MDSRNLSITDGMRRSEIKTPKYDTAVDVCAQGR